MLFANGGNFVLASMCWFHLLKNYVDCIDVNQLIIS